MRNWKRSCTYIVRIFPVHILFFSFFKSNCLLNNCEHFMKDRIVNFKLFAAISFYLDIFPLCMSLTEYFCLCNWFLPGLVVECHISSFSLQRHHYRSTNRQTSLSTLTTGHQLLLKYSKGKWSSIQQRWPRCIFEVRVTVKNKVFIPKIHNSPRHL